MCDGFRRVTNEKEGETRSWVEALPTTIRFDTIRYDTRPASVRVSGLLGASTRSGCKGIRKVPRQQTFARDRDTQLRCRGGEKSKTMVCLDKTRFYRDGEGFEKFDNHPFLHEMNDWALLCFFYLLYPVGRRNSEKHKKLIALVAHTRLRHIATIKFRNNLHNNFLRHNKPLHSFKIKIKIKILPSPRSLPNRRCLERLVLGGAGGKTAMGTIICSDVRATARGLFWFLYMTNGIGNRTHS